MRIGIMAGHNVYIGKYFDCGSAKNPYVESDIAKETVAKAIALLKAQGHQVFDITPYNQKFSSSKASHQYRCKKADDLKLDILLDVHLNASNGQGHGAECWVYKLNNFASQYATKIQKNLIDIGMRDRGVKAKPSYWTVSLGKTPAIIIEGGFIDNAGDMKKLNADKYAKAIAGAFGKVASKNTKPVNENMYRVRKSWGNPDSQNGAYSVLDNAIEQAKKLGSEYKVYDKGGKQVFPTNEPVKKDDTKHWAYPHYKSLTDKGYVIHEKRFDDSITRGEVFKLLDMITKENPLIKPYNVKSNNGIHIININKEYIKNIRTVNAKGWGNVETLESAKDRLGADIIVSGGLFFYDSPSKKNHSLNRLVVDGVTIKQGVYDDFGLQVWDDDTIDFGEYPKSKLDRDRLISMISGSPTLVKNKVAVKNTMPDDFAKAKHPRLAVGETKDSIIILVTDGRSSFRGLTLVELTNLMLGLGVENAINLDGGGSAKVIDKNGVVNKQSTNRPVNNFIAIDLK